MKVPTILDPKPFNNQTVDELPQTLPNFDPTCDFEDGNSFTYDSKSNLVDDSLNVFNSPLLPLIYSYEFCRNDAYYGHDCSLQVSLTYDLEPEHEANINTQLFQYPIIPQPPQEEINVEFLQEKRNQVDYVKTFLRKFNRISFYEMPKDLSLAWETILEIELAFEDKHCQPEDILKLFQILRNDVQNIHEELAVYINTLSWDRPTVYYDDDDEDCTIAITPILSTEEPDNSLSTGDEHLDTISTTKSDEFIKSSVENLVSIPSESDGNPGNMCDVPFHGNSPPLDISKDQFEDFSDSNVDSTSIDDDSFSIDNIYDSTSTHFDISLPHYEAFYDDHVKETSSGRGFTMDEVEDTFPTREPRVHNALPTHPTLQLNLDFILSSESLFAYVVWIFLPFLSYSVAPQYLLSFGNEDTIFDPSISSNHISSFMPDVSHRSGTFMKINA
nr:hypothetical protein [Tanacetum cinerariifolium]